MKKIEILSLIIFTFLIAAYLSSSHISILYNLVKILFILFHFSLVVGITVFFLDRADTRTKKEVVWILFGVLFFITLIIGYYIFPSEEITRILFLEPFFLIVSIFSIFLIRLSSKLEGNNEKSFLKRFYIIPILIIIFIILLTGIIFLPLLSNFILINGGYLDNTNIHALYPGIPENIWTSTIIPILKVTYNNPLPFSVYIPIDSGMRVCTFSKEGNLMTHKGLIYRLNYFIDNKTPNWVNENDWYEPNFPKNIKSDPASSFHTFWYSTKRNLLVLKIPAFSKIEFQEGSIIEDYHPEDPRETEKEVNKIGSIRLLLTKDDGYDRECADSDYYKEIKFQ